MTDLITHPTANGPDSPQLPPPPAAPAEAPRRPPRGARRFMTGVVLGAAVGAVVAGGIVAIASSHDDDPVTAGIRARHEVGTGSRHDEHHPGPRGQAEPSIVSIHDSIAQTDIFGRQVEGQAAGTGFVLSADGYIVTNNHVIDGATDITVRFTDGDQVTAAVVAADAGSDLAVLKVRSRRTARPCRSGTPTPCKSATRWSPSATPSISPASRR